MTLTERIARMGGELLVDALTHPDVWSGPRSPKEGVTPAEKLLKEEARIKEWTDSAAQIEAAPARLHALPGVFFARRRPVKIWKAEVVEAPVAEARHGSWRQGRAHRRLRRRGAPLPRPGKPKTGSGPFLQSLPCGR